MAPRKDIHRPSALKVEDYEFIKFDYLPSDGDILGEAAFLAEGRAYFRFHMEKRGGYYAENKSAGNCYICGARNIYSATFWHKPSNEYIHCGLECASHLECEDAEAFKKKVKVGLEAVAGKRKAKLVLEKAGAGAAWALYEADIAKRAAYAEECKAWREANPEPVMVADGPYGAKEVGAPVYKDWGKNELIVLDMVSRLIKWGDISDKALGYLKVLLERIEKAPEIAAARAAEAAAADPVPVKEGRWVVEGEVLSIKAPGEYDPFPSYKMLVKNEAGWKVWGSVPAAILSGLGRGDKVRFAASVKRSDKDAAFGFFSRPAKAEVFKKEEEAA